MSEPLSTDDIEDVVSSVRRLLSPEARPRPMSRDLGQDRLLLTPALRVVSEPETSVDEAAAPQAPAPQEAPQEAPLSQEAPEPPAASALVLDVPAGGAEAQARGETSELVADAAPEAPMADLRESADPEAPLQVVDGEWEDAFWSEPEPALAELALGAEEAELVVAENVLPAAGDQDPATWGQDQASVEHDEPVPFVALHRSAAKAAAAGKSMAKAPPADETPPIDEPLSEQADAATPERGYSDANQSEPGPAEPDPADDGLSASALDTADETEAGVISDPQEPDVDLTSQHGLVGPEDDAERATTSGLAASEMAEVLTDQDGNPVTVLDEDALSQIVRMLIREELQGVLGERITHNVRKLVRAEINRALTAKSLD